MNKIYANVAARQSFSQRLSIPLENNNNINNTLEEMETTDLDLFLKIITLIQKHYIKWTNNLDRAKVIIQIIKELEAGY